MAASAHVHLWLWDGDKGQAGFAIHTDPIMRHALALHLPGRPSCLL